MILRIKQRTRQRDHVTECLAQQLNQEVWSFEPKLPPSGAYERHYFNLLRDKDLVDHQSLRLERVNDVLELVKGLKARHDSPLQSIKDELRTSASTTTWMSDAADDAAAQRAIDLGIRLWLFIKPSFRDGNLELKQSVAGVLNDIGTNSMSSLGKSNIDFLSSDFSAKSLIRKGGFKFIGASYFSEHLTITAGNHIRIFGHTAILNQYGKQKTVEYKLYPEGFLKETEDTIRLLFPRDGPKHNRYVTRRSMKYDIDIEAQIREITSPLDLSKYPTWRYRLAEIQQRYNAVKPSSLTQWWYDRRQRGEWLAILIAVIVFILTIIFGIIASVTGILQVQVARDNPQPASVRASTC